jgi:heme/copper-type cytochrome/quinol oxidase subunit 2
MRFIITLLLLALLVLGVWTFVDAPNHGWWLPPNLSTFGHDIDRLFYLILWMVAFFFVLTEGILIWCVFAYSKKRDTKSQYTHGHHKLEMLWTAIPGALLLVITFTQMGTWAEIKFKGSFPRSSRSPRCGRASSTGACATPGRTAAWGRWTTSRAPSSSSSPSASPCASSSARAT